jgi:eukaryotic translation initiation factor 2C
LSEPGKRNYNTLPLISTLNIVLQQHASRTGFRHGMNRFFFGGEKFNISCGINAMKGFLLSVRPSFGQLMVS